MKRRRRLSTPLRMARAVSCSLALHGLGWAALREGPSVESHAVSAPVVLRAAWTEPELPHLAQAMVMTEPVWAPVLLEAMPPDEPPPVAPPAVELAFEVEAVREDEHAEAKPASPYWDGVRSALARALRWPAGWRTQTNVEVRMLAVQDGLLPLAPTPAADDPIRNVVRRALERVAGSAERPPDDVVGRDVRLTVRFEPEP